jgi:L-iditol 2-dehydrogenase
MAAGPPEIQPESTERAAVPARQHVIACTEGGGTVLEQRPVPEAGSGEMLLHVSAVGLCGTDLFKLNAASEAAGTVLGHELVGRVVRIGEGVDRFQLGDRVAVPHHVPCGACELCRRGAETMCEMFRENLLEPGGFAEFTLVRPRAVRLAARTLPAHLTDAAAVFMEPAACVLRGVRRSGIGGGEAALVLGAGSMGLLHLLVLGAAEPEIPVIVVDPLEERRELAGRLGATAAAPPGEAAAAAVNEVTGGLGAGAVFDTVGGPRLLEDALALSRHGGTVVLFAHAPEAARADFDLNALFKHERRILGTYSGALAEQEEIFRMLADGRLDPVPLVSHRLALSDFEAGVRLAREQKALKVLYVAANTDRVG